MVELTESQKVARYKHITQEVGNHEGEQIFHTCKVYRDGNGCENERRDLCKPDKVSLYYPFHEPLVVQPFRQIKNYQKNVNDTYQTARQ